MITAPDLPVELHAEIVQKLHHYRDRPTLLATALVCKEWCTSSQRILFSSVADHWYSSERRDSVMETHMRFLQTIADHPNRLGPLVHSYAQDALACNWEETHLHEAITTSYELWELVEKALPTMINLKHLYFGPSEYSSVSADDGVSMRRLLNSFTFRLKTLTWKSLSYLNDGFPEFLLTQNNLIHLDRGKYSTSLGLLDGTCPYLISVSCTLKVFLRVAHSRNIVAWKWYHRGDGEKELASQSSLVLGALKHLSIRSYTRFLSTFGHVDLNINLLELTGYDSEIKKIDSVPDLPSLRVLVIVHRVYSVFTDQDSIQSTAANCFERLPGLECIILRYDLLNGNYRQTKLSPLSGSKGDVVQEEMNIDWDVGSIWW